VKKILIATTNKDKYKIVTYLLSRAGFSKDEFLYQSLDDINYDGPDQKEHGTIENRAEEKAKFVKEYLKDDNFEYIIGIDDGIYIKGALQENIKMYIKKILYESFLDDGEEFAFHRAYCLITKNNEIYKTEIRIPYTYKHKNGAELKENSYPLSQVSVPLGSDVALSDMNEKEADEYVWEYSKKNLYKYRDDVLMGIK